MEFFFNPMLIKVNTNMIFNPFKLYKLQTIIMANLLKN